MKDDIPLPRQGRRGDPEPIGMEYAIPPLSLSLSLSLFDDIVVAPTPLP